MVRTSLRGESAVIQVELVLFGQLALKFGKELTLEIDENTALANFTSSFFEAHGLGEALFRGSSVESRQGFLKVLLNGREMNPDTLIKSGDKISFVPIVAGG